jgi:4-hydroxy-tetrahydrodipicolinate reductase
MSRLFDLKKLILYGEKYETTIRVLQWGLSLWAATWQLILESQDLNSSAVGRPRHNGKDLGEVLGLGQNLGIIVTDNPDTVLDKEKVDCVGLATTSWTEAQMPDLRKILNAGINCVTITEEMADPEAQSPELAAEIDELAGNGVSCWYECQSGFVLDY